MSLSNIDSKQLGKIGEEKVAKFLKSKGYIIVKRNWRDRYGEVDIIADDGKNIVFVEVKTRSENAIVTGVEAIDEKKKRLIKNQALMFSKRLVNGLPPRIDVAEVVVFRDEDGKLKGRINYIKNAF